MTKQTHLKTQHSASTTVPSIHQEVSDILTQELLRKFRVLASAYDNQQYKNGENRRKYEESKREILETRGRLKDWYEILRLNYTYSDMLREYSEFHYLIVYLQRALNKMRKFSKTNKKTPIRL